MLRGFLSIAAIACASLLMIAAPSFATDHLFFRSRLIVPPVRVVVPPTVIVQPAPVVVQPQAQLAEVAPACPQQLQQGYVQPTYSTPANLAFSTAGYGSAAFLAVRSFDTVHHSRQFQRQQLQPPQRQQFQQQSTTVTKTKTVTRSRN